MAFCENCGNKLNPQDKFCEECGSRVASQTNSAKASISYSLSDSTATGSKTPKPRKEFKMTRRSKLLLGILAIVLVLGFAAYKIGESITSKERIIEKFSQAISEKDFDAVSKYLKSSDPRVKINEESLKAFFDYIDQNPSYVQNLMDSIRQQSREMDRRDDTEEQSAFSYGDDYAISLEKDGKTLLLFDRYMFEIKTYFINVSTNYKDAKIFLGDTEICTSDSDQFSKQLGPYLPGVYDLKAVYQGEYANLESSRKVELISAYNYDDGPKTVDVSLMLDGVFVSVDCDYEDAKVIVNGEDIGLTVADTFAEPFGPVGDSVKIAVQKEFPWGVIRSEEKAVEGQSWMYLPLDAMNDEVKGQIMDTINQFNHSGVEALTARDSSKLVNVTQNYLAALSGDIEDMLYYGTLYKGKYTKAIFDLDSFVLYEENGNYIAEVAVSEFFDSVYYYETDVDVTTGETNQILQYRLIFDNQAQKWLIDGNYRQYGLYGDNIKEFNFN